MTSVDVRPDLAGVLESAATRVVDLARDAITSRGRFLLALSGGATPKPLYELLAQPRFASAIDWAKTHVFWGDERCVAPDAPDSNFRMAHEALLSHVPIPDENVHRMRGEAPVEDAALSYEAALRPFFTKGAGEKLESAFDLVLLGMGPDGHTASLFPHTLALAETTRWVVANHVPSVGAWRITVSAEIINASRDVIFMVSGASKAERLREVLEGPLDTDALPSQLTRAARGRVLWLIDRDAAARLTTIT